MKLMHTALVNVQRNGFDQFTGEEVDEFTQSN